MNLSKFKKRLDIVRNLTGEKSYLKNDKKIIENFCLIKTKLYKNYLEKKIIEK